MSRGMLTDEIRAKSKELLGYEITQVELRLMPYLQYAEWRAKAAKIKRQEDLFIFNVKLWLLARGVNVF